MLKIEHTEVFGWEAAIRGMRNPMNSWGKSDSKFNFADNPSVFWMGENDLKLMQTLSNAGTDHGKFLRMINVTVDIIAPLYWWKEFDTYKIGTVANSCSTMHTIHSKEFTIEDFSCEHLKGSFGQDGLSPLDIMYDVITMLNIYRNDYLKSKSKDDWWQLIQLLPSSYNQKRTVQLNYQVLKNMYYARKTHKLDEWRTLCKWMIDELPYFKEICLEEGIK